MISAEFLIVASIATALLWAWAMWRLYHEAVPIHWLFSLSFISGSIGIALFYYEISYGLFGISDLIFFSRLLWALVILTTALLAISVLVYRR